MSTLPKYLLKLLEAWPIAGPWQLSALRGGINNLTWRVEATDGHAYILRLNPDMGRIAHARYEAAVLEVLSQQQLPFLLPCPIKGRDGDVIVPLERETELLASLRWPLCYQDIIQKIEVTLFLPLTRRCAGQFRSRKWLLFQNLPFSEVDQPNSSFGDLAHIHPQVPDPLAALQTSSRCSRTSEAAPKVLEALCEKLPDLCDRLPQQVLHSDYDPSNILVDQHRLQQCSILNLSQGVAGAGFSVWL